jgi:hypothetical protein
VVERRSEEHGVEAGSLAAPLAIGSQRASFASAALTVTLDVAHWSLRAAGLPIRGLRPCIQDRPTSEPKEHSKLRAQSPERIHVQIVVADGSRSAPIGPTHYESDN